MNTTTNALTVTADDVLSWRPCWNKDKMREVAALRERWTAQDFADLYRSGRLSAAEFLWAALREELIPESILHSLACDFAEAALMRERAAGREPHPELWKAIEIKRAWIEGRATDDELLKAREAPQKVSAQAMKLTEELAETPEWSPEESAQAAIWRAADAVELATYSKAQKAIMAALAAPESAAESADATTDPGILDARATARHAVEAEQAARVIEAIKSFHSGQV